jgi:hypothetical protein
LNTVKAIMQLDLNSLHPAIRAELRH